MRLRRLLAILLATCAACARGPGAPPLPSLQSTTATPPPFRLAYVYVANRGDDTISQLAVTPTASPVLAPFAQPFRLPHGCSPSQVRFATSAPLALVLCSSGNVTPLQVRDDRTLARSTFASLSLPRSTYLFVPTAGAIGVFYAVTADRKLVAFSIGARALTRLATYRTGGVPSAIASFTSAANRTTIYVATTSGINVWSQRSDGRLGRREEIRTGKNPSVGIATAWNSLYWTSPSTLSSYSLTQHRARSIPPPPYASDASGPATADGVAPILFTPPIVAADSHVISSKLAIVTAGRNGRLTLFLRTGRALRNAALPSYGTIGPVYGRSYVFSASVGGQPYESLYLAVDGNQLLLLGLSTANGRVAVIAKTSVGTGPNAMAAFFPILGPIAARIISVTIPRRGG